VQCIAACTEAPCLQANYRYVTKVADADFDALIDDLREGRRDDDIPIHGVLARVRQEIPAGQRAGVADPDSGERPAWMPPPPPESKVGGG